MNPAAILLVLLSPFTILGAWDRRTRIKATLQRLGNRLNTWTKPKAGAP